jgi:predicted NBD/HSP70 family sugar kinase
VVDVAVAVDVGGTKLLGGLVTADALVIQPVDVPSPRGDGGVDPGLASFSELLGDLVARASSAGHLVRAVGAGFP